MDRLPLDRIAADGSIARAQRRRRASGDALVVGYGITVSADAYAGAPEGVRHRARIDAVIARSHPGLIVSHQSAVVLHGLPWFGPLPDRVLLTDPSRDRAQRLRFSDKVPARGRSVGTVVIEGITTTDLVTAAIDVALRCDRGHAIVVIDAVLRRGVVLAQLQAELDARTTRRGRERVQRLLGVADARTESPGESLTNLVIHDLELPAPVLQHEFRVGARLVARVDFWFPEHGVVVEFDGLAKYRDRDQRGVRSPEDVVIDEKLREDAVRSFGEVHSFARVTWRDVLPGGQAPTTFARAGLPVRAGVVRTAAW